MLQTDFTIARERTCHRHRPDGAGGMARSSVTYWVTLLARQISGCFEVSWLLNSTCLQRFQRGMRDLVAQGPVAVLRLDEFLQLTLRVVVVCHQGQVVGDGAVEIEHEATGG